MNDILVMSDNKQSSAEKDLAKKNIRLAIILGLIAAGFYIGFVLFYF
jgi:uncharacterized membrane protein (DUF485 family)|tara:strand:+ start:46 stop:186 length:141 start_codon:yes stop_codon:yes gene_type:complete